MGAAPQFSADLVTHTEEILNGKLHFLCSDSYFEVTYEYPLVVTYFCEMVDQGKCIKFYFHLEPLPETFKIADF